MVDCLFVCDRFTEVSSYKIRFFVCDWQFQAALLRRKKFDNYNTKYVILYVRISKELL